MTLASIRRTGGTDAVRAAIVAALALVAGWCADQD